MKGETIYIYASTQRPISLGTYPKEGLVEFWNYDERQKVEIQNEVFVYAWGILRYNRKLSIDEVRNYELTYVGVEFF